MGYEDKMASYHHYFNNAGSVAWTGMVEIVTEPTFMNENVASFKKNDECSSMYNELCWSEISTFVKCVYRAIYVVIVMEDERKHCMWE